MGLVGLLPGTADQPPAVARRRLVVGMLVLVTTSLLMTIPGLYKGFAFRAVAARFLFFTTEMVAVALAASLVYRVTLERRFGSVLTIVSALAVSAVVASLLMVPFWLLVARFPELRTPGDVRGSTVHSIIFGAVVGLLHCGVWALAFVVPYAADDARLRALETDKLKVEAAQLRSAAELSRLRSQLEPHFLLNTLNAVAGLVTENPREARRLLACLGDLLRDSLADADELQPLEDEVAWLRRYAEILESRHHGVLRFEWEISHDASQVLVPRLLLQPLVENAVKHGALMRRGGGCVTVRAAIANGGSPRRVVCTVEDNGPGLDGKDTRTGAFGIHSVRRRLALRYQDARLSIESGQGGTRSIVEIPCEGPSP